METVQIAFIVMQATNGSYKNKEGEGVKIKYDCIKTIEHSEVIGYL